MQPAKQIGKTSARSKFEALSLPNFLTISSTEEDISETPINQRSAQVTIANSDGRTRSGVAEDGVEVEGSGLAED